MTVSSAYFRPSLIDIQPVKAQITPVDLPTNIVQGNDSFLADPKTPDTRGAVQRLPRGPLRGFNPQIEIPAFSQQLHTALAAAGFDTSSPIKINDGPLDKFGLHEPVVDPSTPNADRIQAVIDGSDELKAAYRLAQSSLHAVAAGKLIDEFQNANARLSAAQGTALFQRTYAGQISLAEQKLVSIEV